MRNLSILSCGENALRYIIQYLQNKIKEFFKEIFDEFVNERHRDSGDGQLRS